MPRKHLAPVYREDKKQRDATKKKRLHGLIKKLSELSAYGEEPIFSIFGHPETGQREIFTNIDGIDNMIEFLETTKRTYNSPLTTTITPADYGGSKCNACGRSVPTSWTRCLVEHPTTFKPMGGCGSKDINHGKGYSNLKKIPLKHKTKTTSDENAQALQLWRNTDYNNTDTKKVYPIIPTNTTGKVRKQVRSNGSGLGKNKTSSTTTSSSSSKKRSGPTMEQGVVWRETDSATFQNTTDNTAVYAQQTHGNLYNTSEPQQQHIAPEYNDPNQIQYINQQPQQQGSLVGSYDSEYVAYQNNQVDSTNMGVYGQAAMYNDVSGASYGTQFAKQATVMVGPSSASSQQYIPVMEQEQARSWFNDNNVSVERSTQIIHETVQLPTSPPLLRDDGGGDEYTPATIRNSPKKPKTVSTSSTTYTAVTNKGTSDTQKFSVGLTIQATNSRGSLNALNDELWSLLGATFNAYGNTQRMRQLRAESGGSPPATPVTPSSQFAPNPPMLIQYNQQQQPYVPCMAAPMTPIYTPPTPTRLFNNMIPNDDSLIPWNFNTIQAPPTPNINLQEHANLLTEIFGDDEGGFL